MWCAARLKPCDAGTRSVMSEDIDSGAAYLAALRQSTSTHGAAAAAARAPENPPSNEIAPGGPIAGTPKASGIEKRRSPRYKCAGSARLQEFGKTVAAWATVADISMHGCYVEAASPYPVGSSLEMKLEVNGSLIEVTGAVRVSYPSLGMGISFTRMSETHRERLRELMRSISRPSVILGPQMGARLSSTAQGEPLRAVANPAAAVQAILTFFENRHTMGREEFLQILRKSQESST
jgi:hypothetical protein